VVPHGSQLMDDMIVSSTYEITPHGVVLLKTHGTFLLDTHGGFLTYHMKTRGISSFMTCGSLSSDDTW
jgi:hypothetical protein